MTQQLRTCKKPDGSGYIVHDTSEKCEYCKPLPKDPLEMLDPIAINGTPPKKRWESTYIPQKDGFSTWLYNVYVVKK